jgi:hypothetical protein
MKGQYIAMNELLLFGIGALLAITAAISISAIITPIEVQAQKGQYYLIANLVSLAATKTYLCGKQGECTLLVEIPEELSDDKYEIITSNSKIKVYNFRTREGISIIPPYFETSFIGFATSSTKYFVLKGDGNLMLLKW